jgi:FtsP/CotA-like multicopper oxidase with cupredoxin domain
LRIGGIGAAAALSGGVIGRSVLADDHIHKAAGHGSGEHEAAHGHGGNSVVGTVSHEANRFDPTELLYGFDTGEVSKRGDQTVREYELFAQDKEIEIAPGLFFPAWTYNGRVPGPILRCTEGDRVRVRFTNGGAHPHTIHFHGFHAARMDGVPGVGKGDVMPGETFTYEFDARAFAPSRR